MRSVDGKVRRVLVKDRPADSQIRGALPGESSHLILTHPCSNGLTSRSAAGYLEKKLRGFFIMTPNQELSGLTAVVTGASGAFGRHFSRILAEHGAFVVATARRRGPLEGLIAEITAAGGKAVALPLDLLNSGDVARAIEELDRVDILVNNAGIASVTRAIDSEVDEWRKIFDVNVHAVSQFARHAARKMIAGARGGSIINVASIVGIRPNASGASYSASKAAVISMTKSLALEWARYSIRVNALAPGFFATDMNRQYLQNEYSQAMMKRIPQRRFGQLADLTGPLLLLASSASSYMTGSVIDIDGGHLISAL